jgi:hypothetical protein
MQDAIADLNRKFGESAPCEAFNRAIDAETSSDRRFWFGVMDYYRYIKDEATTTHYQKVLKELSLEIMAK